MSVVLLLLDTLLFQVENILLCDGDFLVRESANSPGQFVLSGKKAGKVKHLLLVDPEGVVSLFIMNTFVVGYLYTEFCDSSLSL